MAESRGKGGEGCITGQSSWVSEGIGESLEEVSGMEEKWGFPEVAW